MKFVKKSCSNFTNGIIVFLDAENVDEPKGGEELKPDELCGAMPPKKECSPESDTTPSYVSSSITAKTHPPSNNNNHQEEFKYQFGNYAGEYCGLQNLINLSDVRLTVFLRHAYLFKDKDILDIGCNVGYMTIAVARRLNPKSIVGVDIDKSLIARARQNLRIFALINPDLDKEKPSKKFKTNRVEYFPLTFPICFGGFPSIKYKTESLSSPPEQTAINTIEEDQQEKLLPSKESEGARFPDNVYFKSLNYAVTDESQMASDKQQYDLILCLSITKWIHLNFGDVGLKMTFRRMFNQLRPGGKLILEAQNWASYKKRKKLSVCNLIINK